MCIRDSNVSVPVTVSEAHGYGMLITVSMAEYDTQAKYYFDGMYRFFKAHPSDIGSHLMSWQQCDNGTELIDGANEGSMTEDVYKRQLLEFNPIKFLKKSPSLERSSK